MSGRIVARTLSAAALGALLAVSGTHAAVAALQAPPGQLEDVIALPNGFLEPRTAYNWEVLAIEPSGNQTLSSGSFRTR